MTECFGGSLPLVFRSCVLSRLKTTNSPSQFLWSMSYNSPLLLVFSGRNILFCGTVRTVNLCRTYIFTGCVCHTWHASRWIVASDFKKWASDEKNMVWIFVDQVIISYRNIFWESSLLSSDNHKLPPLIPHPSPLVVGPSTCKQKILRLQTPWYTTFPLPSKCIELILEKMKNGSP